MKHIPALDGLRAIAIVIVFIAHCGLDNIVPGGFGVTIFFFLSGYLITTLLRWEAEITGRIDLRTFYLRRTIRIWPALYITVLLTLVLSRWLRTDYPVETWGVIAQLAFVSNYPSLVGGAHGVPGIPLWSLAVEEHFYLIFPLLFSRLFFKTSPRKAGITCIAVCIVILAIRIVTAATIENVGAIYYWTHTRIDSILFGSCLALWHNPAVDEDAWRPRLAHVAAAVALLILCFVVRNELFRQTVRYTLQGGALFVIFSFVIWDRGWIGRALSSNALRVIGLYSYTIYLVHVPIIQFAQYWVPGISLVNMIAISGIISMLYAAAMYRLIEKPAAGWRRRLSLAKR